MFILAHLGIGSKLVQPWTKGLPYRWILFGTLFPDFLDKPLYYCLSYLTGKRGFELGLISGTRTFGHTGLFLLFIILLAIFLKSRVLAALAVGVMTHLLLDNFVESFVHTDPETQFLALLFPFRGFKFPLLPCHGLQEHLYTLWNGFTLWGELIGGSILVWDYWKSKRA